MEKLFKYSGTRIQAVDTGFRRYLWNDINWKNRLIVITGARGVGKTTLMLQYIKENLMDKPDEVIYISLDDLYFSKNSLVDFADGFVKRAGKYMFLDEIHKYRNWWQEIKNIYDYFPSLKMIATGSSTLDVHKGKTDLSRRAIMYKMNGLSFREFMELRYRQTFPVISLNEIIENPSKKIHNILNQIKPIKYYEEYIRWGYYPFFTEGTENYPIRLKQIVNHILDIDLPSTEAINYQAIYYIKKLLSILSEIVPFRPNILKLSRQVSISRETMLHYLYLLERADLLLMLQTYTKGISKMNKPKKIYLNNTNLHYSLSDGPVNKGSVRETFFYNQLQVNHQVSYTPAGDFMVDGTYTFEVGGKNKSPKQISGLKDAFIASDDIEYSYQKRIPLWLFGFLY